MGQGISETNISVIYGIGDFSSAVANYAQEDKVANLVIDFSWTKIGLSIALELVPFLMEAAQNLLK